MKIFTRRYWSRWHSRIQAAIYAIRDDTVAYNLTIRNGGIDLTDPFRPRAYINYVYIEGADTALAIHADNVDKVNFNVDAKLPETRVISTWEPGGLVNDPFLPKFHDGLNQ